MHAHMHTRVCTLITCWCSIGEWQLQHTIKAIKSRYHRKKLMKSSIEQDPWPPFHAKSFTSLALVHQKIVQLQTEEDTTKAARVRYKGDIHEIPEVTSSIKLDTIEQIFTPITSDDQCPLSILIEGHPGIGKTTLAKEICLQWANGKLLTSDKLVLLLMLRDPNIQKCTTTEELVKYIMPENNKFVCKYLTKTDGVKTTFIIDGFDELSNVLRHKSVFRRLIEGESLPKARVVVTSRPSASACLHQHVDRRIEVLGFEKCSREQYINDALKTCPSKLQMLKKHFQHYPNIDAMCYIPLNMAIIVFLCLLGYLPLTATELFANFMLHTVCHYLQRVGKIDQNEHVSKIEHLPRPVPQVLQQLCKVAFDGLVKDKIVFTVDDLPDICRDDPICYGLLQAVEYYCFGEIGTPTKSFNFLHLGMQEYFAAKYVATLLDDEVYKLLGESFLDTKKGKHVYWKENMDSKNARLSNMWIMYFGITNGQCNSLRRYLGIPMCNKSESPSSYSKCAPTCDSMQQQSIDSSLQMKMIAPEKIPGQEISKTVAIPQEILKDSLKVLYLFQCFQEAQDGELCDILSNSFDVGEIKLRDHRLLPYQVVSLGFFLSQSNKQWKELDLYKCHIGDYGLNLLHQYLCGDQTNKQKIMTIDVRHNNLTVASAPLISDIITDFQSHTLKLSIDSVVTGSQVKKAVKIVHIQEDNLYMVASAIPDIMTCLKNLNIYHGNFGAMMLSMDNNQLRVLDISSDTFANTDTIVTAVAIILTCNTSLRLLDLSDNAIDEQGASKIAQAMTTDNLKTLKELNISNNNISGKGSIDITHSLILHNNSLEVLDISGNAICEFGASAIAQVIIANKALTELNIGSNNIKAKGATIIARSLMHNASLKVLFINNNAIGEDGGKAIAQAINKHKTLRELDISQNGIAVTLAGAASLATIITNNTLIKLNIAKNSFSAKRVQVIADSLAKNTSLEVFKMNDNIDDYGINIISEAIAVNKTLREFSINFPSLRMHTEESALSIIGSMYYNNSIIKLEIPGKLLNIDSVKKVIENINSTRRHNNIPILLVTLSGPSTEPPTEKEGTWDSERIRWNTERHHFADTPWDYKHPPLWLAKH